ncbi:MAG: TraR/DksA C4-type zinc finger protein [Candidatus Aminicenantes bacterium]|nr:TraR/DksA C4-type zinc finger protein [Candidatus Aminicenantes bacterium]
MLNKKPVLTKKEIEEYRKKLADRRNDLVNKLSEFRNESKQVETDIAQDLADKAESSYTKEFLLSMSDAERDELLQIDAALKRIDKREFGNCLMCQKEIGKKRLSHLPWAPLCIECEEKAETECA